MTQTLLFTGTAKWAMVREPDEKFDVYKVNLYMDDDSWKKFEKSGIQLEKREDEDGSFVTFKRKDTEPDYTTSPPGTKVNGPPKVYLKDAQSGEYNAWNTGLIGNGSVVTLAVDVWTGRNGVASRLIRVFVDDLVVYEGKTEAAPDQAKLPF